MLVKQRTLANFYSSIGDNNNSVKKICGMYSVVGDKFSVVFSVGLMLTGLDFIMAMISALMFVPIYVSNVMPQPAVVKAL